MTAADVMGIDELADEDIVCIEEGMSFDDTRGNADLLAGGVGIRAGERAQTDLGGALNAALVLIPAVEAEHVCVAEVIDVLVPMRAENAVHVAGSGEDGLCGEGEDNVAVEALAAEKDAALVSALCADEVAVPNRPFARHYLPILLPVFVGLRVEKYGALVKLYKLSDMPDNKYSFKACFKCYVNCLSYKITAFYNLYCTTFIIFCKHLF